MTNEKPGYYAVLPANVRYDKELKPNAKLLYAEISSLWDSSGKCWATNAYFMRILEVKSERSIQDWITALFNKGYINIIQEPGKKRVITPPQENTPPQKNAGEPRKKMRETPAGNCGTIDKGKNNQLNNESANADSCAEQSQGDSSTPEPEGAPGGEDPVLGTLPLNTGEDYSVTESLVQEYAALYPAVDVLQQFRAMKGWLLANPARKKTKRGVRRFINGWLAKEQDRGGTLRPRGSPPGRNPRAAPDYSDPTRYKNVKGSDLSELLEQNE